MDFLPQDSRCIDGLEYIYGINTASNSVYLGLNLQWPAFDVDVSKDKFFLSWHTEQFDLYWLLKQAELVYPKPVLVAYDGNVDHDYNWPDNIQFVRWFSTAKQLEFARCSDTVFPIPDFKFSSLSYRFSQYKKFITCYLLEEINHSDLILTWHNQVGKEQDMHSHPAGFSRLDKLNYELINDVQLINFVDDHFYKHTDGPVGNADWNNVAYTNALVNLTNESFHYSQTIVNGKETFHPGPYITEKTYKPLLAGRPFISVAQCGLVETLRLMGFDTNFGWDDSYDLDCGDLTRIGKIFNTITEIDSVHINDLYEQSLPAVQHNLNHIKSGNLKEVCDQLNQLAYNVIQDFVN